MSFQKHDSGKDRYDLIDHRFLRELAQVLTHGANKYGDSNWASAEPAEGNKRYYSALMRHLASWLDGNDTDEESGLPHLAHAACCLMFLRHYDREQGFFAEHDAAWLEALHGDASDQAAD